ncbi:MAG: hypothetical protein ACKVOB_10085 [Sphingomonas sp.]
MTGLAALLMIGLLLGLVAAAWFIFRYIAPDFDGWHFHGARRADASRDISGAVPASIERTPAEPAATMPGAAAQAMPMFAPVNSEMPPAASSSAVAPVATAAAPAMAGTSAPATISPPVAPVANAPVPATAPAPVAGPAAAPVVTDIGVAGAVGAPDNLLQLKGVGPVLNKLLISLGVRRFDQIAAWSTADIAKVDAHLGNFKGRIVRDNWVEQAGLLARGAIAAFEAKFGKLDSENK